jgi:hypothetical protein
MGKTNYHRRFPFTRSGDLLYAADLQSATPPALPLAAVRSCYHLCDLDPLPLSMDVQVRS